MLASLHPPLNPKNIGEYNDLPGCLKVESVITTKTTYKNLHDFLLNNCVRTYFNRYENNKTTLRSIWIFLVSTYICENHNICPLLGCLQIAWLIVCPSGIIATGTCSLASHRDCVMNREEVIIMFLNFLY